MTISELFAAVFEPLGAEDAAVEEFATIGRTTTIEGELESRDSLVLLGTMKGNVRAEGQLLVEGKVQGDLHGRNVLLRGASLKGNVHAAGDLVVDEGTVAAGNLHGRSIVVYGRVKGDLHAQGKILLHGGCLVMGNVYGGAFAMDPEARLSGQVQLHGETASQPPLDFPDPVID